jgi:Raf kinase inhibitor-like YbhB/YbcL family protein
MALQLISSAFEDGKEIPSQYTCDGEDHSPPLAWMGLPSGTATLALIVDDPDAPDPAAPKKTWVHWILYNLRPSVTGLPAGIAPKDLPAGTLQGLNDSGRTEYSGPCPPIGRHRYFHKLYALDAELSDLGEPTKAVLERAMKDHILATAQLIGTFQRGSSTSPK